MDLITLMKKMNFPYISTQTGLQRGKRAILNADSLVDLRVASKWSNHKPQLPGTSLILKRPEHSWKRWFHSCTKRFLCICNFTEYMQVICIVYIFRHYISSWSSVSWSIIHWRLTKYFKYIIPTLNQSELALCSPLTLTMTMMAMLRQQ